MTRAKKVIVFLLAVVIGSIVLAVSAVNLVSGDTYRRLINATITEAAGRSFAIDGAFELTLTTSLSFSAADIRLANADWGRQPEMLRIKTLTGRIALLPLIGGVVDADLTVVAPQAVVETHDDGRSNWSLGSVDRAPATDRERGGIGIRPGTIHLAIDGGRVTVQNRSSGDQHDVTALRLRLDTGGRNARLALAGAWNAVDLDVAGTLDRTDRLFRGGAADVQLSARVGGSNVAVHGTVGLPLTGRHLNLKVTAATRSLAEIAALAGNPLPDLGPIALAGTLTASETGRLALPSLKADVNADLIKAAVTGSVADVIALSGVDLKVAVETDQLTAALALLGVPVKFPLPQHVAATGSIAGSGRDLALSGVAGTVRDEGTEAKVRGEIKRLATFEGVSAEVAIATDSLARFSKYAGTTLPPLGPLEGSTRFLVSEGRFQLANVDIGLDNASAQARLTGSVADLQGFTGVTAEITGELTSLSALNDLLPKELPATGPVTLSGRLTSRTGLAGPSTVGVTAGMEGLSVGVDGSVANLLTLKRLDLGIRLKADTLARIGTLIDADVALQDAVDLEGRVITQTNGFEIPELRLQLGETAVRASADIRRQGNRGRPQINGTLHFGDLDLTRFSNPDGDTPPEASDAAANETEDGIAAAGSDAGTETADTGRVFSSRPLEWEQLRAFDADIAVTGDRLKTIEFLLEDIAARLAVTDGRLRLEPFDARVGSGAFDGMVAVDGAAEIPTVSARVDMDDATFHNFGGRVDLTADLNGTGRSVAALMAGLDGHLVLQIKDAELKDTFLTSFGSSLLASLNPLAADEETTHLDCAVIGLDIDKGLVNAKRKIALQMSDITWFGSGTIDLATERINFKIHSKARKGLGIGLGGLAKLVAVGGTLARPKIRLDPTDIAFRYGKRLAAVSTGGLSIAAEILYNRNRANSEVCESIVDRFAQLEESEAGPPDAAPEAQGAPPSEVE
jgi:uncharacterized protein involved in outer membrane biogenesis